ncbi:PH domain-containing protein [Maribacter sp.]|uniref:PH domain-containing protein n=1 Tax=Maribacter sp. TaxID=1897614 RepID=UPI0025C1E91B|nr:PH domain-containing protein [Maribacter sp.]
MLIAIFLLFFIPVIFGIVNNGINKEFYTLIGILIPTYAFILHTFLKTEYKIENNTLKIKCGIIFNKTIDISKIKKISHTNSLISSPAPSFDRIELKYGKFDEMIISPKDKLNFANDLTQINTGIENNIIEN